MDFLVINNFISFIEIKNLVRNPLAKIANNYLRMQYPIFRLQTWQ